MCRRSIIKSLKINFLILGILVFIIQSSVLADVNITYKTIGNLTTFYAKERLSVHIQDRQCLMVLSTQKPVTAVTVIQK